MKVDIWSLFDLLAPCCLCCGLPAGRALPLCAGCDRDLPRLAGDIPLPGLDRCLAATAYAFPVDRLVQQLKFGGRLPVARVLGQVLAGAVREAGQPLPAVLLPVPLHPQRRRERGYNQAARLAAVAGGALGLPVLEQALVRTRATPAQSGLDLAARRRNLQGAFAVRAPLPSHVAVVDDVVTTGSTLQAVATALRAAGVARVEAWAVAHTL